jgi:hypothetical protein
LRQVSIEDDRMIAGRALSADAGWAGKLLAGLALLFAYCAVLAADFPALTGRIVDQANIISAETKSALEAKFADLESKSGIQLVVATVTSLGGQDIETTPTSSSAPGGSARRQRATACCCWSLPASIACGSRSATASKAR